MAKDKAVAASFWQELIQFNLYKRSQGRISRQVTFAALFVAISYGAYQMMLFLRVQTHLTVSLAVPAALWLIGSWISYRLVNYQRFADFLIAVEAEMNKVSWPTRIELFRNSVVVIVVIFILAVVLFVFDLSWVWLFQFLRVVPGDDPTGGGPE